LFAIEKVVKQLLSKRLQDACFGSEKIPDLSAIDSASLTDDSAATFVYGPNNLELLKCLHRALGDIGSVLLTTLHERSAAAAAAAPSSTISPEGLVACLGDWLPCQLFLGFVLLKLCQDGIYRRSSAEACRSARNRRSSSFITMADAT
jgi:hypothetical protein